MIKYILTTVFIFLLLIGKSQLSVGDKLPVFILENNKGELIDLNATENDKFIFIDFWASWCGPCRKANKKIAKYQSKFEELEVVGISIDTDENKWKEAIKKDKLNHINLIERMGFDGKVVTLFGVEVLPSSFLINKEKQLIAINPTEKEIQQLIKNKQ